MTNAMRLATLVALLSVGLMVGACQSDSNNTDTGVASEINEEECGAAFVDFVSVEDGDDGGYVAVAMGHYPAACDELGQVAQKVDGNAITIRMCSTRPPDVMCAQQLTPFVEELPIDTDGLESGTYTVQVNDATMDQEGNEATLTIE